MFVLALRKYSYALPRNFRLIPASSASPQAVSFSILMSLLSFISRLGRPCFACVCVCVFFLCDMQAIAHADKLFGEEGQGWKVPPLYPAVASRMDRWASGGSALIRWGSFVKGVQQQVRLRSPA